MERNLLLLYISVFITIVGFGMVFPLLPFYAQEFGASSAGIGVLAASFPIGQLLFAPIFGQLSDKVGRRPILMLGLAGSAFSFFLFGLSNSLPLLIFSRGLHGVFTAGAFPIASAYIGDSTTKEDRATYMARLTAMFSLGIIVGPGFAGILSIFSSTLPFYIAGIVSLIAAIFVYVFLPESLEISKRSISRISIASSLDSFWKLAQGVRGKNNVLFFAIFGWAFAISNFQVAFPLFTQSEFGFTSANIGFIFSLIGGVSAISQFFVLPRLVKRYSEYKTAVFATFMMGLGQIFIPYSATLGTLFLFTAFSVFGGSMIRPTINTILSKETDVGQGTIMGIAFSFTSIGRIIGPVIAGALIAYMDIATQFLFTGFVLFLASVFLTRRYSLFAFRQYFRIRFQRDQEPPL